MIWTPEHIAEKQKELFIKRREEFIDKAKNADAGYVAMMETIYESPDFESYPEQEKQLFKDFFEARKL